MAGLFHDRTSADCEHFFTIGERNFVFEFRTADPCARPLYCNACLISRDTDPDLAATKSCNQSIAQMVDLDGSWPPAVGLNEKLSFNFDGQQNVQYGSEQSEQIAAENDFIEFSLAHNPSSVYQRADRRCRNGGQVSAASAVARSGLHAIQLHRLV